MQTGEVVRYELLLGYRDTLIYAHGLTLYQVMDLLVNHYCIANDEPNHEDSRHLPLLLVAACAA